MRVGGYELLGEIGAGGMAAVHLGRAAEGPSRAPVAIKRLHAHFAEDADFYTMFLDEARVAMRIVHPNVIRTLEAVSRDDELFLVMEYVEGEPFSQVWRRVASTGGRIPVPIAVAVVAGALAGLHAAHEAKGENGEPLSIVHRDVSPQNILVGRDGVARLADFGVAKATGRLHTTRDGALKGKLSYMAPEQIGGGLVTRRTDLYAVGIILWECVTGVRLYDGKDGHIVQRLLAGTVDAPSRRAPGLSPVLDAVVVRALHRQESQRFATAAEMARALVAAAPPASAAEVAAWLEAVAGEDLQASAARVARAALEVGEAARRPFAASAAPDEAATVVARPKPRA